MEFNYTFKSFMCDMQAVLPLPKSWIEGKSYEIYREMITMLNPIGEELRDVCVKLISTETFFPKPTDIYQAIVELRNKNIEINKPVKVDEDHYYDVDSYQEQLEQWFSRYPLPRKSYVAKNPINLWMGKTFHYSAFKSIDDGLDAAIPYLCSLFGITRALAETWICLDLNGCFDDEKKECGFVNGKEITVHKNIKKIESDFDSQAEIDQRKSMPDYRDRPWAIKETS